MMTKEVILILVLVITFSCEKEIAVQEKIDFYISINDFELKDRAINNKENIPNFAGKYTGGNVMFANKTDTFYVDTKKTSIEDFQFELSAGVYDIEIETPTSLYGQGTPSFRSKVFDVIISDLTDTIKVNAEPTCALIVVKDELNQLENGAFVIERRSLDVDDFKSYPFVLDSESNLYYTYIFPDTVPGVPNVFLWFYSEENGKEKGGVHTEIFEIGYKYLIKVLE